MYLCEATQGHGDQMFFSVTIFNYLFCEEELK